MSRKESSSPSWSVVLLALVSYPPTTSPAIAKPSSGRTTFVNTLCGKKVLQSKDSDDAANAHLEEGVRIKPVTVGKNMSGIKERIFL